MSEAAVTHQAAGQRRGLDGAGFGSSVAVAALGNRGGQREGPSAGGRHGPSARPFPRVS